jgi:hypothetical protein
MMLGKLGIHTQSNETLLYPYLSPDINIYIYLYLYVFYMYIKDIYIKDLNVRPELLEQNIGEMFHDIGICGIFLGKDLQNRKHRQMRFYPTKKLPYIRKNIYTHIYFKTSHLLYSKCIIDLSVMCKTIKLSEKNQKR